MSATSPLRDVQDTSGCPRGVRCESCGREDRHLRVSVRGCELGVLCLTLCPGCAKSTMTPPVRKSTMARLVAQHSAHLRR